MAFTTSGQGQQVWDGANLSASVRRNLLAILEALESRVEALEEAEEDTEYAVSSFAELQAAVAAGRTRVHLYENITATAAITLPRTMTIFYRGKMLIDGGFTVQHYADVGDMTREQKFSGFSAGDIYGAFGTGVVYPEWWGLTDNNHDIAINCAIQANANAASNLGLEISLGDRQYDISKSLDLSGTKSVITGLGDGRSAIWMVSTWNASTFVTSSLWSGTLNHAAAIWIGHSTSGTQTFRTGVRGVTINCYHAAVANPTKRISGISSKGWVEENSFVEDVSVTYFTGVGVGFPVHTDYVVSAVINGLYMRSLWITQGMKRDAYPLYFSHNCVRASVGDVTIGMALERANSASAITPPAFVMDWPRYGIVAKGFNLDIRNIHIEGVQVGIFIEQSDGAPANITIDNVNVNHMMRGSMVYYDEPIVGYISSPVPPPSLLYQIAAFPATATRERPFLDEYSTAILIGTAPIVNPTDGLNIRDSCNARNIVAIGRCDYLVRDCVYGVHASAFGQGQSPETATGCVKQYIRNNSRPLPTNGAVMTCTCTSASPGVVTATDHGFVAGSAVSFTSTGTVPTGLGSAVIRYVTATSLTANTFTVAATPGGAPINTSSTGTGTITVTGAIPRYTAGNAYFGTPLESPSAIPSDKTYFSLIS